MRSIALVFLLVSLPLLAERPKPKHAGQMLYFMKNGSTERAIEAYRAYTDQLESHEFEMLHEMAWALIEKGVADSDTEVALLSLFGASLSGDEHALQVLLRALRFPDPQIQMAAIKFLAMMNHDEADKEIMAGMGSNALIIRFETLLLMAQKKMPDTALQAEALLSKIPKVLAPLFPPIYAQAGDATSLRQLRRFLSDPDDQVRASAILSVQKTAREEFLPQVRRLSKHVSPLVQEAAASCLGTLKDELGREHLERLAKSQNRDVRLTALKSLWLLGDRSAVDPIFKEGKQGNLSAIILLGDVPGHEDFLAYNLAHTEPLVQLNAAIALLERKDPRCLAVLLPYLLEDEPHHRIVSLSSPAKSLTYFRTASSLAKNLEENQQQVAQELSLRIKEQLMLKMLELPQGHFLQMAEELLDKNARHLLPSLVSLMEKCPTEETVDLLKKYQEKLGAPLVRQLCSLGLYRMGVEGPYRQIIHHFVREWNSEELIRFRPLIPTHEEMLEAAYQLTPEEISRILVESLEALVQMQDNDVIDILLDALCHGNEKNRYALAGVLIRATL